MVQFSNLLNDKNNRKVREVIENGDESIFVYEPTQEDIAKIIDLQELLVKGFGNENNDPGIINITGVQLVRDLFPLLTNIKGLEELTDDEVTHIVSNPTIALIQTQHVIEMIVTQVYKTVILSAKKQILDVDFELGAMGATEDIVSKSLAAASNDSSEVSDLVGRINQGYLDVIEAEKKENKQEVLEEAHESKNEMVVKISDYQKQFAGSDDEE